VTLTGRRVLLAGVATAVLAGGGTVAVLRSSAGPEPTPAAAPAASPASPASPTAPLRKAQPRTAATPPKPAEKAATITAARRTVQANTDAILGVTGEKYTPRSVVVDSDGGGHVRFDRTYRGLDVLGGDYVVHSARGGAFTGATVAQVAPITVGTEPAVSRAGATRTAQAAFTGRRRSSTTTAALVIDASVGTPVLAWRVTVAGHTAGGTPSEIAVIVDATTGAVRRSVDRVHTADAGKGHGLHVGDVALGTTGKADGTFTLTDPGRGGNVTRDALNRREFWPGSDPSGAFTDADDEWGTGTRADRATLAVDVHHGIAETWDYYQRAFGRRGIRDDGEGATAYAHYEVDEDNAAWIDSCFCMLFGDGKAPGKPFTTLDIVAHEMTHGVTSVTAGLDYFGESGGLNESTSDIFGTLVEFDAANPADPPDYMFGEKAETDGPGRPLRYMDEPNKDAYSASCWTPAVRTLDVHASSGIGNKFFYNLAVGSGKSSWGTSTPCAGAPAVTGIGNDKAGAIWYRALTAYMVSNTNYSGARAATLRAAADLYGTGSAEHTAVAAAWTAVGVTGTDPVPTAPDAPVLVDHDGLLGRLGDAVDVRFTAIDPQRDALTFTATGLPVGLSISTSGLVTGVPTAKGTSWPKITVRDPAGHTDTATVSWQIKGAPTATAPGPQTLTLGVQGTFSIEATDHPDVYPSSGVTVVATGLPAGMTLSSAEVWGKAGVVSGTPTALGSGTAVLTATDADQQTVTVQVPWTVEKSKVPGVPQATFVTGGWGTALVEWSAPNSDDSDSPVTGYKIKLTPGTERTASAQTFTTTYSGLDRTKKYTIGIRATSADGDGAEDVTVLAPTSLPLTASATSTVTGAAVTLRGQIIKTGVGAIAGDIASLQELKAGTTGWVPVGPVTTDRLGNWSRVVKPTVSTSYRISYPGSYGMFAGFSATRAVAVKYALTVKASSIKPKPGKRITVSGTEKPARAGVKLTLQRQVSGKWVTVTSTKSTAKGAYAFSASFKKGTWKIRVVATGTALNATANSATITLTVK
jgi:Zn-dependent metalloprotease